MPLIRRHEPDLRELIAYIVARSRERQVTLNRLRLVKLLYLVDVERVRTRRQPLTGLTWRFFHYGPYALELVATLDDMEGRELVAQGWNDSVLYRAAPEAPDGSDWVASTQSLVDNVIRRYAPLDTRELLDFVYFKTGPMRGAERGELLELSRGADDPPARPAQALAAPPRPTDVNDRLEAWRRRSRTALVPVTLDPPGSFLDDPKEDLGVKGVTGHLNITAPTEL